MKTTLVAVKIILIIVITVSIGSVLGAIGYVASIKNNPPVVIQPTITPTITQILTPTATQVSTPTVTPSTDTADWKTYKNEKYGFEFKYPSVLEQKSVDSSDKNISNFVYENGDVIKISVFRDSFDKYKIPKSDYESGVEIPPSYYYFDAKKKQWLIKDGKVDNNWLPIGGASLSLPKKIDTSVESYWYRAVGPSPYCGDGTIIIPNPSYSFVLEIYITNCVVNSDGTLIKQDLLNLKPEQILSTFKFIKTDSTADWKTYRNEKYGFEIKYPTQWNYNAVLENQIKFREKGKIYEIEGSDMYAIGIFIYDNTDNQTIKQMYEIIKDKSSDTDKIKSLVIGNMDAIQTLDYLQENTILLRNNKIYNIVTPEFGSEEIDKNVRSVYDKMLSTFNFIEK